MNFKGTGWNLSPLKVMVVDDQAFIQEQVARLLEKIGISRIVTCGDPEDALQKMKASPVDLVIIDWQMSPYTGKQLIENIQASEELNPKPDVFMLTASPTVDRVDAAMKLGVKSFLAKPLTAATLHEKIINYVKSHRKELRIG